MFNSSRRTRRRGPSAIFRLIKITVLLAVVGSTWVAANLPALRDYIETKQKRDAAKAEVERLRHEIDARKIEREQMQERGFGDEAVARERFQLIKPGEKIVFLEKEGQ